MTNISGISRQLLKHGIAIMPDTILFTYLKFERGSTIYSKTVLKHVEIGAYSYINISGAIGNTKIGRYCSIGPDSSIGLDRHPLEWVGTSPFPYSNRGAAPDWRSFSSRFDFEGFPLPVTIGHDVWIGTRVIIAGSGPISIGSGSVIASGSVVTHDVPPYAIVAGNPARVIRYRFEESLCAALLETKWWDYDIPRLLNEFSATTLPWDKPSAFVEWWRDGGEAQLAVYKDLGPMTTVEYRQDTNDFLLSV